MKVGLDATPLTLSSGGLARYVRELSTALAREFPEDSYFLLSDQPFPMPPGAPANLVGGRQSDSPAHRRWWLWGIRTALQQVQAQAFHGTNFEVPYLRAIPAILTIHDLSPWRQKAWHDGADRVRSRTPWLVRLGRARMILTVSNAIRSEVISHFNVAPDRVRAIPLAASGMFVPQPPEAALPHEREAAKPFFLFVATLEPRKNVQALVDGWSESRAETGADLVIAGRTRSDFAGVAPVEGLRLLGEVPDLELPRLYSNALAFVYPSHYEGFGLPVLEAMQCGCPVIASRDPAVMEVCGGAAIHVTSAWEIADAMRSVAASADLRASLHCAGLRRASDFSWARTARETRALYAEVIA